MRPAKNQFLKLKQSITVLNDPTFKKTIALYDYEKVIAVPMS
ncbi:hypothetical protein Lp90_1188 [Lactiplantibacillus plantarum]|nr:hypothetical protein Lp90_1188 [Lactiplantibacillus plantarum]